jgi:hypothetical protein
VSIADADPQPFGLKDKLRRLMRNSDRSSRS